MLQNFVPPSLEYRREKALQKSKTLKQVFIDQGAVPVGITRRMLERWEEQSEMWRKLR